MFGKMKGTMTHNKFKLAIFTYFHQGHPCAKLSFQPLLPWKTFMLTWIP